jgi:hypothetical protein
VFQCYVRYTTWQAVIVVSTSLSELIRVGTVWSEIWARACIRQSHSVEARKPDVVALRIEGNHHFQRWLLHGLPPTGRAFVWRPLGRRTLEGIS